MVAGDLLGLKSRRMISYEKENCYGYISICIDYR